MDEARLLIEASRLRSVSRALVREDDSEDLVQEALVTALSQTEPPRKLGPWLRQVVRNGAKSRARTRARRTSRELESQPPAGPEAPDDLAFRRQLLAAVESALEELDEPYRDVLRRRFLHDMAPAQIAAETDTAPATVRWRIHEGIRRLRESLDAHFEGRTQWLVALAALWMVPGTAAAAPTASAARGEAATTGETTMKTTLIAKLIVGAAAATALALALVTTASTPAAAHESPGTGHPGGPRTPPPPPATLAAPAPLLMASADTTTLPLLEDCSGEGCASSASDVPCIDPDSIEEPIQVNVQWEPDGEGGHVAHVTATSGCYEPDMCTGKERPQCADGLSPTEHPELAACLFPQFASDPPEHLVAGESWGMMYWVEPECGEACADESELQLPPPSEGIDVLDPQQARERFGLASGGSPNAEISVMECGAYSCFYTEKARESVERLLGEHPELDFQWLHFPRDGDDRGVLASLAAEAARNQGKFWSVHDALFDKDHVNDRDDVREIAAAAGLDVERFLADLDDPATAQAVADQRAWCTAYGVLGTPSFFIEGRMVRGAQGYEALASMVDEVKAERAQ